MLLVPRVFLTPQVYWIKAPIAGEMSAAVYGIPTNTSRTPAYPDCELVALPSSYCRSMQDLDILIAIGNRLSDLPRLRPRHRGDLDQIG
jgi:hypothetical protein